jgi:N-acetylglucosaminyl-diphospho-decaprenol L-rhamnosyltransferase
VNVRARIVVVNYNGADYVRTSIESALAQSVPCEVVVVDNASTDGSPAAIASACPAARIVANDGNRGFAHGANVGALAKTEATPDYVAFLNPDAIAAPAWIERLTDWMEREDVDVASSVVSSDGRAFFAGGRWLPFLGTSLTRFEFAGEPADWVSGCALVVKTPAFETLGGFDSAYFLYCEDVDLSLRAAAAGLRVGVFPEALVAHPEPGRSADALGSLRKRCIAQSSKGRLVRRFVPWFALPTALLFTCLVSPALNGASLGDYPALLRAFREGFNDAEPLPPSRSRPGAGRTRHR